MTKPTEQQPPAPTVAEDLELIGRVLQVINTKVVNLETTRAAFKRVMAGVEELEQLRRVDTCITNASLSALRDSQMAETKAEAKLARVVAKLRDDEWWEHKEWTEVQEVFDARDALLAEVEGDEP